MQLISIINAFPLVMELRTRRMQQQTLQHQWRLPIEVVVSIGTPCFLAGGIAYVAGSVFFLPKFIGEYGAIGAWLFVAGVSGGYEDVSDVRCDCHHAISTYQAYLFRRHHSNAAPYY